VTNDLKGYLFELLGIAAIYNLLMIFAIMINLNAGYMVIVLMCITIAVDLYIGAKAWTAYRNH